LADFDFNLWKGANGEVTEGETGDKTAVGLLIAAGETG